MYFFNSKYSHGKSNEFDNINSFNNIQLGVVTKVGKVPINSNDSKNNRQDIRFNSDEHIIRCRIIGSKYDNNISDEELPNCLPILPRHLNFVPKLNEVVLVLMLSENERYSDRFYIGPLSSSNLKLNSDTIDRTGISSLSVGLTDASKDTDTILSANGVYDNPQNVIIEGRNNTDIIQRENEVLIRSGKFVINNPSKFNKINPSYIQLKSNYVVEDDNGNTKNLSVNNIVSDKINLLTYGDKNKYNLTNVDSTTKLANYITDEELERIMKTAHPMVFGDIIVEYLKLLKSALLNHVHNGSGNKATDRTDGGSLPLDEFIKNAERLEKEMLSDNIRIN